MRAAFAILSLTLAAACASPGSDPLVSSVQNRMNALGFSAVDVDALSTKKVSALHLALQGNTSFGLKRIRKQQEVKVILSWED